jgi:hypothetical protein
MRSILRDAIYRKHKECNCTIRFIPLHSRRVQWNALGNGIFYSISRDHKQPIKRLEFNKVLYKPYCMKLNSALLHIHIYLICSCIQKVLSNI